MTARDPNDLVGFEIDAADRILENAKAEFRKFSEDPRFDVSLGSLLHGALMAWVSEAIDAGLITESEPEIDRATEAIAELTAKILLAEETRTTR